MLFPYPTVHFLRASLRSAKRPEESAGIFGGERKEYGEDIQKREQRES